MGRPNCQERKDLREEETLGCFHSSHVLHCFEEVREDYQQVNSSQETLNDRTSALGIVLHFGLLRSQRGVCLMIADTFTVSYGRKDTYGW